jgi:flagellar L-ring protein precursor FlgH
MAVVIAAVLSLAGDATAQAPSPSAPTDGRDGYDQLFSKYLQEARELAARKPASEWEWMNGLSLDTRARQVNDLITIHVVESVTASGSADSALSKSSDGSASLSSLFGLEKKMPSFVDLAALAGFSSDTDFSGGGATTRAGDLRADLTARVIEVLPNGDMVVEGVREIEINGDRQILVLTGVVRPADIGPANVVLSPKIGQLRTRYFGQGLIRDNLKPGWLIRFLNRIF